MSRNVVENYLRLDSDRVNFWLFDCKRDRHYLGGYTFVRPGQEKDSYDLLLTNESTGTVHRVGVNFINLEEQDMSFERLTLCPRETNLGGTRWMFECPDCARDCKHLYITGQRTLRCRRCHRLTYTSCQRNHRDSKKLMMLLGGPAVLRILTDSVKDDAAEDRRRRRTRYSNQRRRVLGKLASKEQTASVVDSEKLTKVDVQEEKETGEAVDRALVTDNRLRESCPPQMDYPFPNEEYEEDGPTWVMPRIV